MGYYFYPEQFTLDDFSKRGVHLPESIVKSVPKRQVEFFAGRVCAKEVLSYLGAESHQVMIGENRAPVWPSGFVGSITHSANLAIVCAASTKHCKHLGIDVEETVGSAIYNQINESVIGPSELKLIAQLPLTPEEALTLIFSAKESLFKALYPKVGHYFEFLDAKMIDVDTRRKNFEIELQTDLTKHFTKGLRFSGTFTWLENKIFTIVYDSA